ncbi:MAG: hypothetical protein QXO24_01980 [Candidatus Micrarchaeaceae archaeon]
MLQMNPAKTRVALIFLVVIPITCGLGIGGFFAGSRLFGEYATGKFAKWASLGVPPDKAVRIVRLDPNWSEKTVEVDVVTTTGKFYRYATKQNKWIEVDIPESERYVGVGNCERIPDAAFNSHLGVLPAKPVSCGTMIWNWEWFADEVHFIVLEDGTVWWWRYYTGFDRQAIFLCGGSIIGVCLGLVLLAILRHLRRRISNSGVAG